MRQPASRTVQVTYIIYYLYLRFLYAAISRGLVTRWWFSSCSTMLPYLSFTLPAWLASAGVCPRASVAVKDGLFSANVKQIVFVFLQSATLRHFAVASVCRTVSPPPVVLLLDCVWPRSNQSYRHCFWHFVPPAWPYLYPLLSSMIS